MKHPRQEKQEKQEKQNKPAMHSAMNTQLPLAAAFLAAALALGACGGGGGSPTTGGPPPSSGLPDSADPRVAQLGELLERADRLRMSGLYGRWSLAAAGEGTIEDSGAEGVICAGARCVAADGTVTTARGLLGTSATAGAAESTFGRRGGFDTAATRGAFEAFSETLPGLALTVSPEVTAYGFWGEHGFAALALGAGALSAEIEETSYSGDFSMAQAYVAGDASGTNPAGTGSATWIGIAEASPTGTFGRLTGTATVTIADLSRPRVGVAIDVPGHSIGAPGWADMRLANGGFRSGTAGTDYLAGGFHGPAHEEAWGVFDTADWLGVFGAKRQP